MNIKRDKTVASWDQGKFVDDYVEMIKEYQGLKSKPEIYLVIPSPSYLNMSMEIQQNVVNEVLPSLIREIGKRVELGESHVIDFFKLFRDLEKGEEWTKNPLVCGKYQNVF